MIDTVILMDIIHKLKVDESIFEINTFQFHKLSGVYLYFSSLGEIMVPCMILYI